MMGNLRAGGCFILINFLRYYPGFIFANDAIDYKNNTLANASRDNGILDTATMQYEFKSDNGETSSIHQNISFDGDSLGRNASEGNHRKCHPGPLRIRVEFWGRGVVIPIICIIGIICSITNLTVLTRPKMINPTNIFLIGLDVSDLGALITLALYYIYFYSSGRWLLIETGSLEWLHTVPFLPWRFFFGIYQIPTNIFVTASNTSALSVSIFRYIAVGFPIKAQTVCTMKTAKCITVCIFIWAVVLNIPEFFLKQIAEGTIANNFTGKYMDYTKLFENRTFQSTYHPLKVLLNILIPWIACLVLSILLISNLSKRINNAQKRRSKSLLAADKCKEKGNRERQKDRITVTLIAINLSFLICETPGAVWSMLYLTITDPEILLCDQFQIARIVMDILAVFNFGLNFFIYLFTNMDFRKTLQEMYCGWFRVCQFRVSQSVGKNMQTTTYKGNSQLVVSNGQQSPGSGTTQL